MQNQYFQAQRPQSPRSVLPPLSKYYYPPAQGSASPQRANHEDSEFSPSYETSGFCMLIKPGWVRGSSETIPPALPPRQPGNVEPLSASQWMNHFASKEQLWQLPGPPASAPPTSHVPNTTYESNMYGPMLGAQPGLGTSYNSPSLQRRPSNSRWEDDNHESHMIDTSPVAKPPLPVCRPMKSKRVLKLESPV